MKHFTTILLLIACSAPVIGQSIIINDLTVAEGGTISFSYTVNPKFSDRESYQLQVFSSTDNFTKALPLSLPTVKAGELRVASFSGPQMLGNYEGALQLKFKAVATAFPVQITTTAKKFKSGKNITISWDDFHDSGFYDVDLYQNGYVNKSLAKSHRGNSLTTPLPKKLPKGTYEIRVTPSNRVELYSEDYPVTVKGGGMGMLILAGGAAVGAGAFVLGGSDGGGGGGGTDSSLPDPPNPGDGN
jgi:DUF971 family protein